MHLGDNDFQIAGVVTVSLIRPLVRVNAVRKVLAGSSCVHS